MAAEKKCCVPNCGLSNEILHKFPNPNKDIDRFRTWIYNVGGDILGKDNEYIFKYRRVCHLHFESKYHTRNKTLSINAVPTLRLSKNGILPDDAKDTADLLIFIDKSFDSMNGSLQNANNRSGKELLRNVTPNTLHKNEWTQSKNILKSMNFVSATGSPGISRRSVARIVKERNTPQPSTSKPWRNKTRKIRCDKIILDEYEEGLLRRKIHEFYAHKQEVPTLNKLYEILREEIGFQGSREILRKIIKNIGFKYVRSKTNRRVLVERNDLSASRAYYLQAIKQNEETEKLPVIYLDETCIEVATVDVDRTLYTLLGNSNIRVWVHASLTRDSAKSLSKMRPEPSFYIILGDHSFVTTTYKRAVKERLVKRDYRWNLVITDYETLDPGQLILPTVLLQLDSTECCKLLGMSECTCSENMQRKQQILNNLIKYVTETLIKMDIEEPKILCDDLQSENGTRDQLYKMLQDENLNNKSLFYWNNDKYILNLRSRYILSTHKQDKGLQKIADWSAMEEYKLLPGVELEPLRNFFRIGTYPAVPWTLQKLDPDTGQPMFTEDGEPMYYGYCIDLIDKIAEAMGFDYEIVTPKVGDFGKRLANGTWDGVVGDLMTGETDMSIAALTMTAEREEVIDFVAPYFEQTGILIVIRKPIRKTSLFKFMTVLRTEVWLSIVAALLLTGFMIWLLEKYSPYSARNNPDAYPYPCREFTLKESFWFALTSFTPQGGGEAPKALSGRTLVAAYWLFVVLMLATFTANLAAFLTVERMQTPVSSLEQLARQSRINYTVVEGSTVHQYFINMKFAEDTLYRVWKEITLNATSDQAQYRVWDYPIREQYGHILLAINASGPVPDALTGFQQVNEHTEADFAFIHDSAEVKYEITRNCNLTEVGEVFAEQPYAIAVQQGSRLQEDLSRTLLDLQKERFLEQLASKYWNETARQSCPDADESEGITLESLGGVFIATLFGLGLAMLTLAWEVFYYKRKEKNKIQALDANLEKEAFPDTKTLPKKIKESVGKLRKRKKTIKTVTIGDSFKPAKGVSYINVYPRNTDYRP